MGSEGPSEGVSQPECRCTAGLGETLPSASLPFIFSGIFSQLLAGLKSRFEAEEGGVREDVSKEQEKEGKAMDESPHGPAGFRPSRGRRPRLPEEHLCLPGAKLGGHFPTPPHPQASLAECSFP